MRRLRAARACDSCRLRKTKCDARNPCSTCLSLEQRCVYGAEALSKGKSEMILETVLRLEASMDEIKNMISSPSTSRTNDIVLDNALSSTASTGNSTKGYLSHHGGCAIYDPAPSGILTPGHLSSAESLLMWPIFTNVPSIYSEIDSHIIQLEHTRPPFVFKNFSVCPYVSKSEIKTIIGLFQETYNFWYPTMSLNDTEISESKLACGDLEPSCRSCLSFLLMALGCVGSILVQGSVTDQGWCEQRRSMADAWFDAAMKMLHLAHIEVSVEACQCLFLTALYFAFLQRPLQTWSYANAAATRCRFLLSSVVMRMEPDDRERVIRVFWACFILESNYISELPTLPQNCISEIESAAGLPSLLHTHVAPAEEEKSVCYFLACIAMRRLLNRVHFILYDRHSGLHQDFARLPTITKELERQLQDWRATLPESLWFSEDVQPEDDHHTDYLRQWYSSCRSVIYRPYLVRALGNPSLDLCNDPLVLQGCQQALNACLSKILNTREAPHTAMVNAWTCSLSVATAVLTILAASYHAELRQQLYNISLPGLCAPLKPLLEHWMHIPTGGISPGIEKALRLISKAQAILEEDQESFSRAPRATSSSETT